MRTLDAVQVAKALSATTTSLVLLVMADRPINNKTRDLMTDALMPIIGAEATITLMRTGTVVQIGDVGSLEDLDTHRTAIDELVNLAEDEPRLAIEAILFSAGTVTGYSRSTARYPGYGDLHIAQELLDACGATRMPPVMARIAETADA